MSVQGLSGANLGVFISCLCATGIEQKTLARKASNAHIGVAASVWPTVVVIAHLYHCAGVHAVSGATCWFPMSCARSVPAPNISWESSELFEDQTEGGEMDSRNSQQTCCISDCVASQLCEIRVQAQPLLCYIALLPQLRCATHCTTYD